MIFAVLEDLYHHVVLTQSFKLASFLVHISALKLKIHQYARLVRCKRSWSAFCWLFYVLFFGF